MADLPQCGLYRTGRSLAGHEENVPTGALIYFHNHSEQGSALVLPPDTNTHNRWKFHERGWLVDDPGFLGSLIALKPEGLYIVAGRHLHLTREEILPEKTLVQLGYNRRGDTILFPALFEANTISFSARGHRFESPDVQKQLEPVGFKTPAAHKQLLH